MWLGEYVHWWNLVNVVMMWICGVSILGMLDMYICIYLWRLWLCIWILRWSVEIFIYKCIMKTRLCMFWKNVDVASKLLINWINCMIYYIWALGCYKLVGLVRTKIGWFFMFVCNWYEIAFDTCSVFLICLLFSRCMQNVWKYCRTFFRWAWEKWVRRRMLQVWCVGYLYVGCTFAKTNIQVWCWTRCSNILARFSVPCTCAVFYTRFIYLRNPRLISCWPSCVLIRQNQMVYLFLKLCQQFRKLWMCLVCSVRCSYILGPSIFVADSCETAHRLFVDCSEATQEVITRIASVYKRDYKT